MAAPIRSTFGTRLLTNFLTYQGIFWNSWPCTENFRGQGWSGCGLGINGKRAGAGTNAVKNSGYFLACNVAVMLKIETRPGCTRTKSCDASRETKKNKKVTSKQEQRLNFKVNFDFWFCNDDFCENRKAKMQCCQPSQIIWETPDFEPFHPVSKLESEISRIIAKVCNFL